MDHLGPSELAQAVVGIPSSGYGTKSLGGCALRRSFASTNIPLRRYPRSLQCFLFVLAALTPCWLGCAHWSKEHDKTPNPLLTAPHRTLDSVVLDSVLVRFPLSKVDELESLWDAADESVFDIGARELHAKNGLRAGVVIGELPRLIREQMRHTSELQSTDALEHAGLAADVDNKMRKLQCRAGRRKDLIVRPEVAEPLTVLTTLDGKSVSGETYSQPTVLFDLRALPQGDGSATVELTPEIQHGMHRQAFVGNEFGALRPELRRDYRAWRELTIRAKLQPGQVLMVSCTEPAKALGRAFFRTNTVDKTQEHVILLLRLSETQLDELFAPQEITQAKAMAEL